MTIWKWTLELELFQEIECPEGTTFLHVGEQSGHVCLWGLCDETAAREIRKIAIVGTGNPGPAPEEARYIGSVVMAMADFTGGPHVWHVFEPALEEA